MTHRFIRFDLFNPEKDKSFNGHAYLDAKSITAVVDMTPGKQLGEGEYPVTHITCANQNYSVRHRVDNVLATIDAVLRQQADQAPIPVHGKSDEIESYQADMPR